MSIDNDLIISNLREVFDPEISINIYDLGLIYDISIDQKELEVTITHTLTSAFCPFADEIVNNIRTAGYVPEVVSVIVETTFDPPFTMDSVSEETKLMMANSQDKHSEKMASGELEYSGKLLEARQSDWKDEFVLIVLTLPILVIAYGVFSDDPGAASKIKEFFEQFQQLPSWFTNLWILVVASIYGIKGTQIFKGKK